MRNANMGWDSSIPELVDNSMDAGARNIDIWFQGGRAELIVRDDGIGCDDPYIILRLGHSRPHPTTRIGWFGVGATDAIIASGNECKITSCTNGITNQVHVNLREFSEQDDWSVPRRKEFFDPDGKGTTIKINSLLRDPPQFDAFLKKLARRYYPAIREGMKINFRCRGKQADVPLHRFPELTNHVEQRIEVNGLHATINAGLVKPGQSSRDRELCIYNSFRVIIDQTSIGLGENPPSNLFGWVELHGKWPLTKHKDGIEPDTMRLLGEQIHIALGSLVDKAKHQSKVLLSQALTDALNRGFANIQGIPDSKAKRKPRENNSGTVEETGNGTPHQRAKVVQPGNRFSKKRNPVGGVVIDFDEASPDDGMWRFSEGKITFNANHPCIAAERYNEWLMAKNIGYAGAAYLTQFKYVPYLYRSNGEREPVCDLLPGQAFCLAASILFEDMKIDIAETSKPQKKRKGRVLCTRT